MATTYRPITDGAGQEIVNRLKAILTLLQSGTKTTVNSSDYTDKSLCTETTGRNIGTQLESLLAAFETYCAPSASKVAHALTIGSKTYDGSEDVSVDTATTSAAGLMSASDKTKLDGIATGAEVNQNAFAKVTVGSTTITADAKQDTLTLVAGSNITLTPDSTNDKVTITAKNTTYSAATTSAAGLMSASDKTKLNGIATGAEVNTITGVKGNAESSYRTGQINLTPANILGATQIGSEYTPVYYDGSALQACKKTLNDYTWAEISEIARSRKGPTYFNIGDEKSVTLSTGEEITVVIVGFLHDYCSDEDYDDSCGITFGLKNCLQTKYAMNSTGTNVGGWTSSNMRTSVLQTILSQLPSDLQDVILAADKETSAGNKSTTIETTQDKLWLFSEVEVDGTTSTTYASEGSQYAYFKRFMGANEARMKGIGSTGSASGWWLRSPDISYTTYFRLVNYYGVVGINIASASYGVCFGFCV